MDADEGNEESVAVPPRDFPHSDRTLSAEWADFAARPSRNQTGNPQISPIPQILENEIEDHL
jgi:hypothetical protein